MTITQALKVLRTDVFSHGERGAMTRSTMVTAGLQLAATAISFVSSLLYARVLGPHGFGLYAFVIACADLATIAVTMGIPAYLVREGAGRTGAQTQLRRWADRRILAAGLLAALTFALVAIIPQAGATQTLFLIAAPIPLITALAQVRQSLLASMKRVATGQWPRILGPLVMTLGMLGLWLWTGRLRPVEVTVAALVAGAIILVVNSIQLDRKTAAATPRSMPSPALRAALPFMVMGMLFLINSRADIIMLGTLNGPRPVGVYAIVVRAAAMLTFVLAAVEMVIAPRLAAYYRGNEMAKMQRLLTASARRAFLLILPLAALYLVAGESLLRLLYGDVYTEGTHALQILTVCYLFSLVFGSSTVTINMCGFERLTLWSVGAAVVTNVLLNALLIPILGMVGAAIATGISTVSFSFLQWYWARRHVGVQPGIFST